MALSPSLNQFFDFTQAIIQNPEDYHTKAETLGLLMQMKALASTDNALAKYRLAQVYPKNSAPYSELMQASAKQGLTNAMLTLSLDLAEKGTVSGLQQSALYVIKILQSNDSYIKNEAIDLLARNSLLNNEVTRQMTNLKVGQISASFFAINPSKDNNQQQTKCLPKFV